MDAGQSLDGSIDNNEDPRGLFYFGVDVIECTQRSVQRTYKQFNIDLPCAIAAYIASPVNGSGVPIVRKTCARSASRWIHIIRLIYP
jgi:hypothetical protein